MKKTVAVLALGVFVATARAEEPPHLDFVQKLRASHYPDLALEYLEKLDLKAPADMRPSIELEMARTRLDLARAETDAVKKPALLARAREGFEAFVKNNPNSVQASEARLEITSLAVLQGKAQLQKAMRQSGAGRRTEAAAARVALDDAAKQLEIGIKELDLKLVKYDDAKTPKELKDKKDLEDAKLRAMLDRGVILLEEVQTFSTTDDSSKDRADVVKQARNILEKTMALADTHAPVHWQAQAWIGKAIHEDGDLPTARARLEKIIKMAPSSANTPGLDAGKRLATYFLMQIAPEVPQQKVDATREQYDLGQTWLKTFSRDLDTPEGQHVRFLLGEACVKLAQTLRQEKNPKQAEIDGYHAQAEKLFKGLEQPENDFSDRARLQWANVVFTRTGGEKVQIKSLPTFEACYIRALFEAAQMERDGKTIKDAVELEKTHKKRTENMVAALELGLKHAEAKRPKPPDKDVDTATAMLVYAELTGGKYDAAITTGERMVRQRPFVSQAAAVAMYTLQAYGQILAPESKLGEEEEEGYRERMKALAKYVADRWPNDAAADVAHFQMGLLLIRDKRYPEAVDELASVKPTFGAAIHSQYHLANTAFQIAKDKGAEKEKAAGPDRDRLAKEEQAYKDRAVKALESLPDLPAGADAATNQIYIYAKVRLGQHLYTLKKYAEMDQLARPLLDRLHDMRLADEAARGQAKSTLTLLTLYAAYGKAADEFAAGQVGKARESLDKIVDQLKAGSLPELKKDPDLRGGILGLALRASFQEGKLDRAKEILKVIQDSAENPQQASARAILPSVAKLMKDELDALRKKNDKAALERATLGFGSFLDELAKGQADNTPEGKLALARAYSDLDQHAKVIDITSKIEEPKDKADQRAAQTYHAARILSIRAYRLDDKLDEAEKVLQEALNSWGKNNVEVQFERIHLLDARKNYGAAATEWNKMTKQLLPRIKEPDIKPRYYEAYCYKIRSLYDYGVAKKETKYVKQAVSLILALENSPNGFGSDESKARFLEMLSQEKELKDEYDRQKSAKQ